MIELSAFPNEIDVGVKAFQSVAAVPSKEVLE